MGMTYTNIIEYRKRFTRHDTRTSLETDQRLIIFIFKNTDYNMANHDLWALAHLGRFKSLLKVLSIEVFVWGNIQHIVNRLHVVKTDRHHSTLYGPFTNLKLTTQRSVCPIISRTTIYESTRREKCNIILLCLIIINNHFIDILTTTLF